MTSLSRSIVAGIFLCLVCGGCGKQSDKLEVHGKVTLDGQPLQSGEVRFVPISGGAGTAGAPIKNGEFHATTGIAKFRVEISAMQIEGGKSDRHSSANEKVVNLVPDRYSGPKSDLTFDAAGGSTEPTFDLKSR